jgi:ferric-dicitrate binding protein FerR (iron transport regulator)
MNPTGKNNNDIIDRLCQGLSVPEGIGKDAVWSKIIDKIETETHKSHFQLWTIVSRVAAVFIGLLVVGSLMWVFVIGQEQIYSPFGTHQVVILPDSSVVNLNADSHLKYNKVLWAFNREVELNGEALFVVKKGKKFSVKTGQVVTQVLGTTFNIYSRNNEIRVSCIEGKVGVKHTKTQQSFILEPNQKVSTLDNKLVSPSEIDKPEMAEWINGVFYFNNEPLTSVLAEFQRQYNVKVILKAPANRLYTGVFYNNNIHEALDLICTPMQLKWNLDDGIVTISKY